MLIDTHTHLYSDQFNGDIKDVIQRSRDLDVGKHYLPAIDSETHTAMLNLEERFPDDCIAMMGLHPCSVNENYKKELREIESWLGKRNWVAVGEIGLDFYWDKTFTAQQYEAFELQIKWAKELDIPIIIHTRNATEEAIQVIEKLKDEKLRGIFHCYSGTLDQAKRVIDLGFYLGIGGVVTFKNGGLAEIVKEVPLQHLVLETDSPYLAPVPHRGKRNESSYLGLIAEKVADLHQVGLGEVAFQTTQNARGIFF
ncbi:MAG: TatD family hydrolase [Bacteroidia bacterium]|nr:TatD family hydrolase [Bacteroidia bacterium]